MTPAATPFTRAYKATGHARLSAGAIAGTTDTTVTIPLERVVTAHVRIREGATTSLTARGPERLAHVTRKAAQAFVDRTGFTGSVDAMVRPPAGTIGGALNEAVTVAVLRALAAANELPWSSVTIAEVTEATWGHSTGIAYGRPAIVTNGRADAVADTEARLLALYTTPISPAQVPTGGFTIPTTDPTTPAELAQWLATAAGCGDAPAARALAEATADIAGVTVIGGHTPHHPALALLHADQGALIAAQQAAVRASALLEVAHPGAYRTLVTRTGA